ncbi:hypothetical protein [Pantoea sp. C2G6]|uniref:hypothetical protein n=1 Tax=Pantoea sp. C2G6 TaxID=3243084 RepID=UPI003EDAA0C8
MKKEPGSGRDRPIKDDIRWIRREWLIQRVGEYLLIMVVILGACGLFSKGVLSNGSARSPDGAIQVEYERFGRVESNMDMTIRIKSPPAARFSVTLGNGALENLQIQTLQPQPLEAVTMGHDLRLTFSSQDSGPDHAIWLGLQPRNPGRVAVSVSSGDHPPARFTQWIYP